MLGGRVGGVESSLACSSQCHAFVSNEHCMDYVRSQLQDWAVGWFVGLYSIGGPELQDVDAFMWALRRQYEDAT
ncbi:UNVERIFIED_CONTAM: hypothetical protein K2H54_004972 [Gekko kuhli]